MRTLSLSTSSLFSNNCLNGDNAEVPSDYEETSDQYSSNNGSGGQCCSQSSTANYFNDTGAPSETVDE